MKFIKKASIYVMFAMIILTGKITTHATCVAEKLVLIDGDEGSFTNHKGSETTMDEAWVVPGYTLKDVGYDMTDPIRENGTFLGWKVFDKNTGDQILGSGVMTTEQVLNYSMPNQELKFVAQWELLPGTQMPEKEQQEPSTDEESLGDVITIGPLQENPTRKLLLPGVLLYIVIVASITGIMIRKRK